MYDWIGQTDRWLTSEPSLVQVLARSYTSLNRWLPHRQTIHWLDRLFCWPYNFISSTVSNTSWHTEPSLFRYSSLSDPIEKNSSTAGGTVLHHGLYALTGRPNHANQWDRCKHWSSSTDLITIGRDLRELGLQQYNDGREIGNDDRMSTSTAL